MSKAILPQGYIYAMSTGGVVKFGWATNVEERVKQLQTGNPYPINVVAKLKTDRSLENKIHKRLAHIKTHGEWFRVCGETDFVIQCLNDGDIESIESLQETTKFDSADYLDMTHEALLLLSDACKTRAGDVLCYMIKDMFVSNIAYIKPSIIALDMGMDISNVNKYLRRLIKDGMIAKIETRSGVAYLISPALGVKGTGQHEALAKSMWAKCIDRKTKQVIKQSSNVIQLNKTTQY